MPPLEVIQLIKEYCNYREASILTELYGGWKSKSEKWFARITILSDEDIVHRASADHLHLGLHKLGGDMHWWEIDWVRRCALTVTLGWETVESFIEYCGEYWFDCDIYHGPILFANPHHYRLIHTRGDISSFDSI